MKKKGNLPGNIAELIRDIYKLQSRLEKQAFQLIGVKKALLYKTGVML